MEPAGARRSRRQPPEQHHAIRTDDFAVHMYGKQATEADKMSWIDSRR